MRKRRFNIVINMSNKTRLKESKSISTYVLIKVALDDKYLFYN